MHDIAPGSGENGSSERVRLHITPFSADLLDKIIPPSVQPLAHNISFHTVETFPERGFGYVELPSMEAQKIKKKLNGSTLRGTKVRIEDARPERKRKSDGSDDEDEGRKARKTEKKKAREEGVIPGHELDEGRRVKRGWAEKSASSKSTRRKDKTPKRHGEAGDGLDGKKLRFKTSVPPNATLIDDKDKEEPKKKKSKERSKSRNKTVVEEFSNSKRPKADENRVADAGSFSLSYEDGKGWVDETGDLVDAEPESRARRSKAKRPESERRVSAIESRETDDLPIDMPQVVEQEAIEGDSMSVDAPADSAVETETTNDVHPLEALFKRPVNKTSAGAKPRPQPIDTSFSFFDTPMADNEGLGIEMPPQTPHTKRDLEWRSIRSAAPTPDTAAIGRKFSFPSPSSEDEDEDAIGGNDSGEADMDMASADEAKTTATSGGASGQGEESAFRKWFYENRGDLNRGWKKRRREEKKAERQRENRRLGRKVA